MAKLVKAEDFEFDIRSLEPDQFSFPYHFHRIAEELFVIMSGKPMLRSPDGFTEVEPVIKKEVLDFFLSYNPLMKFRHCLYL